MAPKLQLVKGSPTGNRRVVNVNKLFPRLPIRNKLAFAFAVLATAPLLVSGILGTVVTLRYLEASAESTLSHDLQTARERTEHFLATSVQDMRFLAAALLAQAFEPGADIARLDSAAVAFLRSKPSFVQLKLFYADGELILLRRATGPTSRQAMETAGGAYYAYRARSLRPGEKLLLPAEIPNPYEGGDVVAIPIISIVLPLHDVVGEFEGVAVGEVYASRLFTALESGNPKLAAVTGLVGPDGRFLYHSERKSDWNSLLAPEPDLTLFSEFAREIAVRIVGGEPGSLRADEGRLVSFTPLRLQETDDASLFLYRSLPIAAINQPARRFVWGVGIAGLVVLGAALTLALVAATQFTRPIYQLREGARRLAAGDFGYDLNIKTNDELEELAGDFGDMADRLREHTHALEELVAARSQELREAHAELEEILTHSEDAIVRLDSGGRVQVWNRGAEKLFGFTSVEALGQEVNRLLLPPGPKGRREVAKITRELERTGSLLDHHTTRMRKDGEPIEVSVSQTVIRDAAGAALGYTLIIRDVTRHKELERQMVRSERLAAAGRLAAGVAHEINNPIGIVLNRLDILDLDLSERDPENVVRDDLRVIRDQTERVGEVARRLLTLARDEPDVHEPLELNELVGRVIHFLEPTLGKRQLRIELDLAVSLPMLRASHNGLEMVILNLILNAIDASPEGGSINVVTRSDAGTVTLEVCDEGIGIEEEFLERIFEPFFTAKQEPRGTGLGLAVTRGIVQSHDGEVRVTSEPGIGSRFTVTLPLKRVKEQWRQVIS